MLRMFYNGFIVAPDGSEIVYNLLDGYGGALYRRSFITGKDHEIDGTKGGFNQFFSPDGSSIGFFTQDGLKTMSLEGGGVTYVTPATNRGTEGSWGRYGDIVFPIWKSGLRLVYESGGAAVELTTLREDEQQHSAPHFLPDGENVLFVAQRFGTPTLGILSVVNIKTKERTDLDPSARYAAPRYSESGHLLFAGKSALFSRPFDPDALTFQGKAVFVMELASTTDRGTAYYDLGNEGTLAYLKPGVTDGARKLHWLQQGKEPTVASQLPWKGNFIALGPKEERLVFDEGGDLKVLMFKGDYVRSLTIGPGFDRFPYWSPDGEWVYFSSQRDRVRGIWRIKADFSMNAPELVVSHAGFLSVSSMDSDGSRLYLTGSDAEGSRSIWTYSLSEPSGAIEPLLNSDQEYSNPSISSDGHWLVYTRFERDAPQIYVRRLDGSGAVELVSHASGMGNAARWTSGDKEIVYYSNRGGSQIWSCPVTFSEEGLALTLGEPGVLAVLPNSSNNYEISAVDNRVLVPASVDDGSGARVSEAEESVIQLIFNWKPPGQGAASGDSSARE
ncbi:MAG: hypothetical protein HOI66_01475 [Verrucomicrobia bacterium]|nr:hypothetical protein [Verrucomicrobiota bacterium]